MSIRSFAIQDPSYTDWWRFMGTYLGYPTCCIDNFCTVTQRTAEQEQTCEDTGFVPCPNCAEKILRGETNLKDLIQDRRVTSKFPFLSAVDRKFVEDEYEFFLQRLYPDP